LPRPLKRPQTAKNLDRPQFSC